MAKRKILERPQDESEMESASSEVTDVSGSEYSSSFEDSSGNLMHHDTYLYSRK